MLALRHFPEIWLVDFEFSAPPGERPTIVCFAAREFRSGRTIRLWADKIRELKAAPFSVANDSLFVSYYAPAELSCFLSLGWPLPLRILDLFAEFRCLTNGQQVPCGNGLLGALAYYGLPSIEGAEKESLRQLAVRQGPHSAEEQVALLDYCESDVIALAKLWGVMHAQLDVPRALLRGRYMAAVARMEANGIPIDTATLSALRGQWSGIQESLIARVDMSYGVYEGRTFKWDRFAGWLIANGIPWPRLESGELALDDNTFRQMARTYPAVAPLRELRHSLGVLRLESLAVGSDGRNRCMLSPFRSVTGRNQPSNAKFVFGPSAWLRSLIKPERDRAVAYVDWSQQEFGIAAALSGDVAMQRAYLSGDPYLEFAKQAKAVPADATKNSHAKERELFKVCALATQYGMGAKSLALSLSEPEAIGRELLRIHRATYPKFWSWSDAAINHALLRGWLITVFGWRILVGPGANPRSLGNFPMQANGAEMLRLACCLATEQGIQVCAPVHDALLVEGPADQIEEVVALTQEAMAEAARVVLSGFELRSDSKIVRWPDRYLDPRGERMWEMVTTLVKERTGALPDVAPVRQSCSTSAPPYNLICY